MALQAARSNIWKTGKVFSGRNKHVVRLKFVRKKSSKCDMRWLKLDWLAIYVYMYVCMVCHSMSSDRDTTVLKFIN